MKTAIEEAIRVLRQGGTILYPTDTVWGIGCDATNPDAIEKVHRLKVNDGQSMISLYGTLNDIARDVDKAPAVAYEVMELTTSPLTVILPGREGPVGVRIPNHEFCRELLKKFGRPIVSTSANLHGHPTPKRFEEVTPEIVAGVDYVVPQRFAGKPTGKPSSIMQFFEDGTFKIIRN